MNRLNRIDEAYTAFETFMHEHIANREVELSKQREIDGDITEGIQDVFGRLVNARLTEGKLSMSDDEIIGNCFILVRILSLRIITGTKHIKVRSSLGMVRTF